MVEEAVLVPSGAGMTEVSGVGGVCQGLGRETRAGHAEAASVRGPLLPGPGLPLCSPVLCLSQTHCDIDSNVNLSVSHRC